MDIVGLAQFPGGALVERGIRDLGEGRQSTEALLVTIGAGRLRDAGMPVPRVTIEDPEVRLYEILAADDPDSAHGRYNALLRQLTSFERAAEATTHRPPGR
jgi:hypothetical protein